jgi:FtsH-binding integral membrane protein
MPTNNEFPLRLSALLALLIGLLLVVQGILGLIAPDVFLSTTRFIQTPPVMYVAAILRVVFGVVLVRAAPGSRATEFLRVFGFIIVIGGLLTPFVGVWASQHILGWWSASGPALVRVFAGVSLALGILVVYAVAPHRRSSSMS